ncbi:MAG TPA: hypothetical protein VGP37_03945 [Candidatus Nanopelagicales bacterium]|nr:hypothetical protein [Candidatus Nanopelagicales bacterium]
MTDLRAKHERFAAELREGWARLGDRTAIGFLATLVDLPYAVAGPLFIDPSRLGGSRLQWFVVALVGWVALSLVFFLGRWIQRNVGRFTAAANLSVIITAALARAVILALVAYALGLAPAIELEYRVTGGLVTQPPYLVMTGILVSSSYHHRQILSELTYQQQRVSALTRQAARQLRELQLRTAHQVRRLVEPLVAEIEAGVGESEEHRMDIQGKLARTVDDDLRPLIDQLLSERISLYDDDKSVYSGPPRGSRFPRHVPVGRLLKPAATGLLAFIAALSQIGRAENLGAGLIFAFVVGLTIGILIWAVSRALAHIRVWTFPAIVLAGAITSLSFVASFVLTASSSLPSPTGLTVPAVIVGTAVGVTLAVANVIIEQRRVNVRLLEDSIARVQEERNRIAQEEFFARRQLSYLIHGSVQSALVAARMRLHEQSDVNSTLAARIGQEITRAVSGIEHGSAAGVSITSALEDIVELWSGIATVTWTVGEEESEFLEASPVAIASVGEIVTECVANSIRHGSASSVDVRIDVRGSRVAVVVVDDGDGPAADSVPGMGSRMLEDLTLDWRRYRDEGRTVVEAELAQ